MKCILSKATALAVPCLVLAARFFLLNTSAVAQVNTGSILPSPAPTPEPLTEVRHDSTLTGKGTSASPLGVANGGLTAAKINSTGATVGQVLSADGAGGAGWQTLPTPNLPIAFSVRVTESSYCNLGQFAIYTVINNPNTDNDPNALVLLTPDYTGSATSIAVNGVAYSGSGSSSGVTLGRSLFGSDGITHQVSIPPCPAGKWMMISGAILGTKLNVLVIKQPLSPTP